ncbi:MAG: SGNH/GDSL hydrolase family protein [Planctomycetota bacterium]
MTTPIWNNLAVHNAAELVPVPGAGPDAVSLIRLPRDLLPHLNEGAQARAHQPAGIELRWVADGPVTLTLSSPQTPNHAVCLFRGRFQHNGGVHHTDLVEPGLTHPARALIGSAPTALRIGADPPRITEHLDACRQRSDFDPTVRRLLLPLHAGPIVLHDVAPDPGVTLKPPNLDQLPPRRVLFYGTSITQGAGASSPHLTYPALTAARLQADALNLGSSGSCQCEPQLIDHLAARPDWDAACLALSVNMMKFPDDVFAERVRYAVHTIATAHPSKPVAAITLWPYHADLPGADKHNKAQRFRQHLRDAVASCPTPNARLLEGPDLFPNFDAQSADLIHPGDFAFMEMSRNLADALRPLLPATPT